MYSESGRAFSPPVPKNMVTNLQLHEVADGTPRAVSGQYSARGLGSKGKGKATPRGAYSARSAVAAPFGTVRLPKPPSGPAPGNGAAPRPAAYGTGVYQRTPRGGAPAAKHEADGMGATNPISAVSLDDEPEVVLSEGSEGDVAPASRRNHAGARNVVPGVLGPADDIALATGDDGVEDIGEAREMLQEEHERTQGELMGLMERLRAEGPADSEQFHYLKKFPIDDYPANPYHLKIVSHSEIDEEYFFTISASGVTLYNHGSAEFTALTQWHREYYLFNEILRIRMFEIYRIWKTFKVWRRCVRAEKVRLYILRHARIKTVGKSESCMVSVGQSDKDARGEPVPAGPDALLQPVRSPHLSL